MKTSNNCRLVVVLILYFSSLEPLYTQNIENLSQQNNKPDKFLKPVGFEKLSNYQIDSLSN